MIGDSKEPTDIGAREQRHNMIKNKFIPFAKDNWGVDLVWMGNSLVHSTQHDDSSCGPCVINLLERLVYKNTPLWVPQDANNYRVTLFLQMAQYALERMVSCWWRS